MRRLPKRLVLAGGWVSCALLVVLSGAPGCGGSGPGPVGGGGVTVSDAGGGWLGPVGAVTPAGMLMAPAMPGGMTADLNGNATGTGALAGVTGTLSVTDPAHRIFRLTGTGASTGLLALLILSASKDHFLYVDSLSRLGAWQKNATMLLPPYANADLFPFTWTGVGAGANASFDPDSQEQIAVTVDPAGMFVAGSSATDAAPLAIVDPNTGEFQGDYVDAGPPMTMGNVLLLLSPDKQFAAVISWAAGGVFPNDCAFVGIER